MKKENKNKAAQEQPSFFQELGGFMKPYGGQYAVSILLSILGVSADLGSYAFAGLLVARVLQGNLSAECWYLALGAGACRIAHGILCNLSTWCSHHAAYSTLRDVRRAIASKLMTLPLGYFETRGSGRLNAQLTEQVENMETPLAHVLPEMTAGLLVPCGLMIWLMILDWRLGLVTLLWIILGFMTTGGMMKNYPEKFAGQIQAGKAMHQAITEYVGGIEVLKNFGQEKSRGEKYEKAVYGHADYNVNWQKETQIYSAAGMAIAPFSVFPVLIAGLIFVSRGTLEASSLFLAVLLTMGIFGPIMQSMGYFDQLAQMGVTAKELNSILSCPELKRGRGARPEDASVSFRNVEFTYGGSDHPALENLNLQVPEGTMLALVGPSGSGKSTVARLLAGFWDPQKGTILIGGKPMEDYTQDQLNRLIAYVDQDTFLFDKTIADNIRMGNPEATDEMVMEAAKSAGCDGFIRALPQGYETLAGAAGSRLSGGERQRIAIARAMMKDAPILVLDEATASADPENEALIQSALTAAARGKTLVVVAHHLTTVMHADQIACMDHGRIQAVGTHPELLTGCPLYASLWKLSREG